MRFTLYSLLILFPFLSGCSEECKTYADFLVIPSPEEIDLVDNCDFELNTHTKVICQGEKNLMKHEVDFLLSTIELCLGESLDVIYVSDDYSRSNRILLTIDSSLKDADEYAININKKGIDLKGGSSSGLYYAIQTLRKAMGPKRCDAVIFPHASIKDAPRFKYRGVNLDMGDLHYSIDNLKRGIDLLALHHLNVLHWKLCDNQSWFIEIDGYADLNVNKNLIYTDEQIHQLVDYALERHINIIPELDLSLAMQLYPELQFVDKQTISSQQVGSGKLCDFVMSDKGFDFLKSVLKKISDLFPLKVMSLGVVPNLQGGNCIESIFTATGCTLIESNSSKEFDESISVVQCEKLDDVCVENLKDKNLILTSDEELTFDLFDGCKQHQLDEKCMPFKKIYDLKLIDEYKDKILGLNILGVEANIVGGRPEISDSSQFVILPQIATYSELVWSSKKKSFDGFMMRLDRMLNFYKADNYECFPIFYDIDVEVVNTSVNDEVGIILSTIPEADIRYSLDGEVITKSSNLYTDTLWLSKPFILHALASTADGHLSMPLVWNCPK